MSILYSDCDLIDGSNYDGIKYDDCEDCYRYDTCKPYHDREVKERKLIYRILKWIKKARTKK